MGDNISEIYKCIYNSNHRHQCRHFKGRDIGCSNSTSSTTSYWDIHTMCLVESSSCLTRSFSDFKVATSPSDKVTLPEGCDCIVDESLAKDCCNDSISALTKRDERKGKVNGNPDDRIRKGCQVLIENISVHQNSTIVL